MSPRRRQDTRYRELETLRQYAERRLIDRGELDDARDSLLVWALSFAAWSYDNVWTEMERAVFHRGLVEIDNVRAAVRYAVAADRLLEACQVIHGIAAPCWGRPRFEVVDWVDPTAHRARAMDRCGRIDDWTLGVTRLLRR